MNWKRNQSEKNESPAEIQSLFAKVQNMELEPSPYMKTRILAQLREKQSEKGKVFFWKWLAAGTMAAFVGMSVMTYSLYKKTQTDGVTNRPYVIQVDFSQTDLQNVARAEVLLPKDVQFVSSNPQISETRKLKLPVDVKAAGRGKLPFVVKSSVAGEKEITVRLLNDKDQVVREKVLKFQFAKNDSAVNL